MLMITFLHFQLQCRKEKQPKDLVDKIRSISCREHCDILQLDHAINFRQQLSHDTIDNVASTSTMPTLTTQSKQFTATMFTLFSSD